MTAKTLIIVGIVIACLVLFVFGKETMSYFLGARQYANTAIKESIPPEFEIARLKSMLNRLDTVIEKRRSALVEMQLQAEALEKEVENRKARLSNDKALLQRVAQMLAEKHESYVIGGITYSFAEVDADALIKAERFKQDKYLLIIRKKTLVQFGTAINDARKLISDAEVEKQKLANSVEYLAVRAKHFKTISQIDAGKELQSGQALGQSYTALQKAIGELEHKLEKGERLFDIIKTGTIGIDYVKNAPQKSGLDALREALQ
ncbi:MAG: hypothetical protein L6437_15895 [Kiritimatiellae bacterium]|nr:hypothetical protein [Kiritimatiellia bacterium]